MIIIDILNVFLKVLSIFFKISCKINTNRKPQTGISLQTCRLSQHIFPVELQSSPWPVVIELIVQLSSANRVLPRP